jgi:tRNA-2-methylthio-N6-dimethylallyladenosine synthase
MPGVTAYVTIMEGCDKACTYCIVPKTRGQEISRPPGEIIAEIVELVNAGYREIALLGQNVNSYGKRFPDGSGYKGPLGRLRLLEESPESLLDFPALLRRIDAALGGETPGEARPRARIRFTTSHPFDASERLFEAMRDCGSAMHWLHLPVQSGSNRILRAMRRGYTADSYLERIGRLRAILPDVSLSTDIIVGFPGETDEDFEATMRLMRQVRYENAYIFKYSPRPGTDAAAREDSVPQEIKERRNQALLALQEEISLKANQAWEGRDVELLIEGPGRQPRQWFGRSRRYQSVIVESDEPLTGRVVRATIARATAHTLFADFSHCAGHGIARE